MKGFVYQLMCPKTKKPIYVGSTIFFIETRLQGHINSIAKQNSKLYQYLKTLSKPPLIELIEEIEVESRSQLITIEHEWIGKKTKEGVTLLNSQIWGKCNISKKEQKIFIGDTIQMLKDSGTTLGWFLKTVGISRTHWFFIKKGERPLIQEKQDKIQEVLNQKSANIDNR